MGQKTSSQKVSPDAKAFMRKYYPEYPYVELLNDGIMYKTVLITNDKDQSPLLLKIFYKDGYTEKDQKIFDEELLKLTKLQQKFLYEKFILNVVPIINIKNTDRAGIIYRQYTGISLKERINLMPYLTYIDKIWITFQLLYTFNELNRMDIHHADLKPENILLTSNLSVYISDFATYKPAKIYGNDLGSYTYYFGSYNIDNLKGCYLAPERFCDNKDFEKDELNSEMDTFSLGLIIAELFLEKTIFDFSNLLNFKKGEFTEEQLSEVLKGIENDNIRSIVSKMIKLNYKERISINDAFNQFKENVSPIAINSFLFHFNVIINKTEFWKPDLLIGFIYRYWDSIWKIIYGAGEVAPPLAQRLNFSIINKLVADNPISINFKNFIFKKDKNGIYHINDFDICFNPLNGKFNYENKDQNIFEEKNNQDCSLIIINILLQNMQNTKYETSNYIAMEMVKNFCKKLPDITKLQFIIPYFVNNIRRKCYTTKLTSLKNIFDILYSIDFSNLILPITEYNYFDSYIFPQILSFYKPEKPYLVLEFLNSIDIMIDLELKFLNITLKSRLKRLNEFVNKNWNNLEKEKDSENINNNNQALNNIEIKKRKRLEEIYSDYETNLDNFKNSLFGVLMDVMGNINEIDLIITVIRKLPKILNFYGRVKSNDFSKFIINNFNNNEWIVQKELLIHIPEMMNSLGKNILNDYILPCMEMIIANDSNEFKKHKLIKTLNNLLEMEILSPQNGLQFLEKLMPYSIHPNYLIRKEMKKLIKNLFKYLSKEEILINLQKIISPYIKINIPFIDANSVNDFFINKINRAYYLLKLNDIEFIYSDGLEESKSALIKDIISSEKRGNMMLEQVNDFNLNKNEEKPLNNYTILDAINRYIKKEAEMNNLGEGELEKKIFGKIFWLSSENDNYKLPYIEDKNFFAEENIEEHIPPELFHINYLLKTENISIKLIKLNFLLEFSKNIQTAQNVFNNKDSGTLLGNFNYNKNFASWRPQGRLMTTTYEHKLPVEKLIPMKDKKFCSLDWECNPIIWKIKGSDDEFILKKRWSYKKNDSKDTNQSYFLTYKNTVKYLDNLYFLFGSKNSLYSINFMSFPSTIDKIIDSPDDSFITCSHTIGESALESQKILFTSENGSINLFDPRNKGVSLSDKFLKSKGIPYCISNYDSDNKFFFIGTLGGKILLYDLRLNSIISEFKYSNGDCVLGMFLHKNKDMEKGVVIWSGNEDYEIGMWNFDENYNISNKCNLLLKVNSIDVEDEETYEPLSIRIPFIYKQTLNNKNYYIDDISTNISKKIENIKRYKYTSTNLNLINVKLQNNYSFSSNKSIYNLHSIYENPLTVQCVLSPLCGELFYENTPYLLAAGNDRTIRYWDISKDLEKKEYRASNSYIINTPTDMTDCQYKKYNIKDTTIFLSNELYNKKNEEMKQNIQGFSEYQNSNGINYYSSTKGFKSGFRTKNLDVSHKSVITDLICVNLDEEKNGNPYNYLVSSSWDGTIKVWK